RFYILQTHYRSTLDFSNEALQASEKAFRRLWDAYEVLKKLDIAEDAQGKDAGLNEQVSKWCEDCDAFMNDDFNTAKVLANLFELAPVINGIKGGQVAANALSGGALKLVKETYKTYLEDIFGMQPLTAEQSNTLDNVLS